MPGNSLWGNNVLYPATIGGLPTRFTTSVSQNRTSVASIATSISQNRTDSGAAAAAAADAAATAAAKARWDAFHGAGSGDPYAPGGIYEFGKGPAQTQTAPDYNSNDLDYNVGMIGSSYFNNRFEKLTGQHSDVPNAIQGNDLPQQFKSDGQMKGMIVSYIPVDIKNKSTTIPADTSNGGTTRTGRFGFQFHYNPREIDISYTGQPDVALGFEASGTDPAHPAGTAITQSAINFQIPINRREDFKFYDPETKQLKQGVSPSIYKGKAPSMVDQNRIYEYGTMYDIEYLLATCLGYKMLTTYRDYTADIGYVSGQIVEVILGNRLRYLAMVTSVTVSHTIFNQRMVPIHSNLNISMSIVPDFPGV